VKYNGENKMERKRMSTRPALHGAMIDARCLNCLKIDTTKINNKKIICDKHHYMIHTKKIRKHIKRWAGMMSTINTSVQHYKNIFQPSIFEMKSLIEGIPTVPEAKCLSSLK
jgi:hypothetical protein